MIFVAFGIAKIIAWDSNDGYMATRPLLFMPVLLVLALFIELGGAGCLIVGCQTKIAAWIMVAYMVPVTAHITSSVPLTIRRISKLLVVCGTDGWALDSAFKQRTG